MTTDYRVFDEAVSRLLNDHLNLGLRDADESGEGAWAALEDAGLTNLALGEDLGGSGGGVLDAARLLRLAGRYAAPLPLAESALLSAGLLNDARLASPGGVVTTPLPHVGDELVFEGRRVRGRLHRVPWGASANAVVAIAASSEGDRVVVLDARSATTVVGTNVAGDPRDELTFDAVSLADDQFGPPDGAARELLWLRGALSRALLIAGATESVATLTTDYARRREQFGRPILAFQAVGQRLVQLIEETEATSTAVEVAARRFAEYGAGGRFEIAAAKVQSSIGATEVTAHAHQIHGAIGVSREYHLHHLTRRLWAWRQEWGSLAHWSRDLGRQVRLGRSSDLWDHLTTGLGRA